MRMPSTHPLNVTVVVPLALRPAVEGRAQLQLGVPPTADVGDVLQTLLRLYPKLTQHVASDHKVVTSAMTLYLQEDGALDLASRRTGLRHGARLYLSAGFSRGEQTRG